MVGFPQQQGTGFRGFSAAVETADNLTSSEEFDCRLGRCSLCLHGSGFVMMYRVVISHWYNNVGPRYRGRTSSPGYHCRGKTLLEVGPYVRVGYPADLAPFYPEG